MRLIYAPLAYITTDSGNGLGNGLVLCAKALPEPILLYD